MGKNDNNIKEAGEGYALQCTKAVRGKPCNMVSDGENPRLADTYVCAIDQMILVFDADRVDDTERTSLIKTTVSSGEVLGCAGYSKIQIAGNGYQANLPADVIKSAGYTVGMSTSYGGVDGVLVIWPTGQKDKLVRTTFANLRAWAESKG